MQTQIRVNMETLINELTEVKNQEETLETSQLELGFRKGKILLQIKKRLPHGKFLPFLKATKVQPHTPDRTCHQRRFDSSKYD